MLQIEGLAGLGPRCLTDFFLLLFLWNMAEIERDELEFERWKNFLQRFAMPHDETSSQCVVPLQNLLKTFFQGGCVQRSLEPQTNRNMVAGGVRLHLLDEPQPLLRVRQRTDSALIRRRLR